MTFKEALENLQKAKKARIDADRKLVLATATLSNARPNIKQAHEKLTDVLALAEVGEATDDQVESAQRDFGEAEKAFDQAKRALEVAQKVIPLVNQKLETARQQAQKPFYDQYKKQSEPLINKLLNALNTFEETYEEMEELKSEIRNNGLSESNFLPLSVKSLNITHLKHPFTLERYKQELIDLKQ